MPYHVKTPAKLNTGDVYWKGNNSWTSVYADRKQFSNVTDATAVKATPVRKNGVTEQPDWLKNATVVEE